MKYKDFLNTALFRDADIVLIQDRNGNDADIADYRKVRNKEILSHETNIVDDLVYETLVIDFEKL
jgi:hypothetical protein